VRAGVGPGRARRLRRGVCHQRQPPAPRHAQDGRAVQGRADGRAVSGRSTPRPRSSSNRCSTITPPRSDILGEGHDFVLDCIDNMTAKIHLLRTCVQRGLPGDQRDGRGRAHGSHPDPGQRHRQDAHRPVRSHRARAAPEGRDRVRRRVRVDRRGTERPGRCRAGRLLLHLRREGERQAHLRQPAPGAGHGALDARDVRHDDGRHGGPPPARPKPAVADRVTRGERAKETRLGPSPKPSKARKKELSLPPA
jgi:hypothetical protein